MARITETKIQMIQRLLDFNLSKVRITRLVRCSRLTAIHVERGYIHRHTPTPREIERLKTEIQSGWTEKVRTVRNMRRTIRDA